jgi:hypothetical protein
MSSARLFFIVVGFSYLLASCGFVVWFIAQPLPLQDKYFLFDKDIEAIEPKEFMKLQRRVLGLPTVPFRVWTPDMRQVVPRIDRLDVEEFATESEALQQDICKDRADDDCKWVSLN